MPKQSSPWMNSKPRYPKLQTDLFVDAVIIGGGVSGIGVAYALAKTKKSVALLEANVLASGLSGLGSGAMVGGADLDFREMIDRYGVREAVKWLRETYAMRRELIRVMQKHGLDTDLEQTGSLMFARSAEEVATLEREQALRKKYGFRSSMVRGKSIGRFLNMDALAALYVPDDALVNHAKYVLALAGFLAKRVSFYEQTPVQKIERRGNRYLLQTPGGCVYARRVIFASQEAAVKLGRGMPRSPRSRVCSALTRRLSGQELRSIGWHGAHMLWGMGADYSMARLMPDQRILVTGDRIPDLEPFFRRVFPSLSRVTIEQVWYGRVDAPKDFKPLVGRVGGLYYSYALTSHGLINAFVNGMKIVRLMG